MSYSLALAGGGCLLVALVFSLRPVLRAVPSDYGALGYAGIKSVLQAVKNADATDSVRVSIALRQLKYDWYKGPQFYRKCDHQSVQSVVIVESKSKAMKDKYDVFNVLAIENPDEKNLRSCDELGHKVST